MPTKSYSETCDGLLLSRIGRKMSYNDSCGVFRICMMEAGLALRSSFSSSLSSNCHPHLRQRTPTVRYMWALFGLLRLTGASTKTHRRDFRLVKLSQECCLP